MTRGRVGSKPETSLLVGKKIRVWFGPEFLSKPPLRGEREDGTPVDFDVAISRDLWDDLFVWDDLFQDRFISDPGWKESFEGRLYRRMACRLARRTQYALGPNCSLVIDLWPVLSHTVDSEGSAAKSAWVLVSEPMVKPPVRQGLDPVAISQELWDDLFVWDNLFQDRFISDPGWKESFEGRLYARMAARLGRRLKQEVKAAVVVDLWPIRGSGQEWAL